MDGGYRRNLNDLLRPHSRNVWMIIILQAIGVVAQLGTIMLLKPLLDLSLSSDYIGEVLKLGIYLLILTVIESVMLAITTRIASRIASVTSESLRTELMESILHMQNLDTFEGSTTKAMTALTSEVNSVQRYVFETLSTYIQMPMLLTLLFVSAFFINGRIGMILLIVIVIVLTVTYILSSRVHHLYNDQMNDTDRVNNALREKITGARTIRTYGGYDYEMEKFSGLSKHYGSLNKKILLNSYYIPYIATTTMWLFIMFIFLDSTFSVFNDIVPSEIVIFMQYATYIVATLAIIPYISIEVPRARISLDRICDVIRSESDLHFDNSSTRTDNIIEVRNISAVNRFGMKVLDDVSVVITKGKRTSIVGPIGSGGAELMNTILGFKNIQSGSVIIDGFDMSKADPSVVREHIAYAGNDLRILRGTLRFNLDPHSIHKDGEILNICNRIGLDRFLSRLPDGLDTYMRDDRSIVSGGQRLQIMIARCLLNKADVYIFDNCFFSLDPDTKTKVTTTINELCDGRTVLFIMNDTSTCGMSDEIILLKDGKVVDTGDHEGLMGRSQLYRDLNRVGQEGEGTWA